MSINNKIRIYIENRDEIISEIIEKINNIYKIGESCGFQPMEIEDEDVIDVYLSDDEKNLIIEVQYFLNELVTEKIKFPYYLLYSNNVLYEMKKIQLKNIINTNNKINLIKISNKLNNERKEKIKEQEELYTLNHLLKKYGKIYQKT